MEEKRSVKGKRFDKKLLLLPAAFALTAGIVLGLLILVKGDGEEHTIYDTDAFFIRETGSTSSNYALFKKNGDRKTDFIFRSVSAFINGHALVRNTEDQFAIIDQNGNYSIEYGEFSNIKTRGGLYEVTKNGRRALVDSDGGIVESEYVSTSDAHGTPYAIVETKKDQYKVYNATGKEILNFSSSTSPVFTAYNKTAASSLSYDGHLVLLNNKTLDIITNQASDISYSLRAVSDDMKTFVLTGSKGEGSAWALYKNDSFKEYGDQCQSISFTDDTATIPGRSYLSCKKDKTDFLIRGTDVTDIDLNDANNYAVFDENHYASCNAENKFTLYVDGSEKMTASCASIPIIRGKGYFVTDSESKKATLYGLDGGKLHELENTDRASLFGLDAHEHIIVLDESAEKYNERAYIIDKSGKILSNRYSSISANGNYYSAIDSINDAADLLDKNANTIVSGKYRSFKFFYDGKLVFGQDAEGNHDLIDTKGKNVKMSLKGRLSANKDGYFTVTTDDETVFYTFDGKDFYHQSK